MPGGYTLQTGRMAIMGCLEGIHYRQLEQIRENTYEEGAVGNYLFPDSPVYTTGLFRKLFTVCVITAIH